MVKRSASHAGSWYSDHGPTLASQLDGWLGQVEHVEGIPELPPPGARVIIAPHAGYAYSGPPAAWAYKSLDLSKTKRIFLLGPSHHHYLSGCALSQCTRYNTPLGDLSLDVSTITELNDTGKFERMSRSIDENEHSLEMHLPYIHRVLSNTFSNPDQFPQLIPILVGSTSASKEVEYGSILAPYLEDPANVFIVSSDFCHWGLRFSYTYYLPSSATAPGHGYDLKRKDKAPTSPRIHESIARIDKSAMEAVGSGRHETFLKNLGETGNTVCGRHPIGVVMAAIEVLKKANKISEDQGVFQFVRYERSSDCLEVADSSVSYASAFAVL